MQLLSISPSYCVRLLLGILMVALLAGLCNADERVPELVEDMRNQLGHPSHRSLRESVLERISQLSDAEISELLGVLQDDDFGEYNQLMAMLKPRLTGRRLSDSMRQQLAAALVIPRETSLQHYAVTAIGDLLIAQQTYQPYSEFLFSGLLDALAHSDKRSMYAAARILGAINNSDPRFNETMQALLAALTRSDKNRLRKIILDAFASHPARHQSTEQIIATLSEIVLNDADISMRVHAAETLSKLPISTADVELITRQLATQLTPPEHRNLSRGWDRQEIHSRVAALFVELAGEPIPEHITDAWIYFWRTTRTSQALEGLTSARQRHMLSDAQLNQLYAVAADDYPKFRKALYKAMFLPDSATTDQLLQKYAQDDLQTRIKTGVELQVKFTLDDISEAQVDRVSELLFTDPLFIEPDHEELRATASELLTLYSRRYNSQEPMLLAAYRRYHSDQAIGKDLLAVSLRERNFAATIMEYAGDQTLPATYRRGLLWKFNKQATPQQWSTELEKFLLDLIDTEKNVGVTQAAGDALQAIGKDKPLIAILMDRRNQSAAISTVWFALVAIFVAGLPLGSIFALLSRVGDTKSGQITMKLVLLVSWWAYAVVAAITLLMGLLSGLGHNNSPSVETMFSDNIPAYVSMCFFIIFLLLLFNIARKRKPVSPQSS